MKSFKEILEGLEGEYDLNGLYDKYNRQLFRNELPKIPIKWNNTKATVGTVAVLAKYTQPIPKGISARYNPTMGKVTKWKHLTISKKFDLEEQDIHSIMIHEMIHVKLMNDGILKTSGGDQSHGTEFDQLRIELDKKVPFKIAESEGKYTISKKIKPKRLGYVYFFINGKHAALKTSEKFIRSPETIRVLVQSIYRMFGEDPKEYIEIGISDSIELQNIIGVRKPSIRRYQYITKEQRDEIQNGQVEVVFSLGQEKEL